MRALTQQEVECVSGGDGVITITAPYNMGFGFTSFSWGGFGNLFNILNLGIDYSSITANLIAGTNLGHDPAHTNDIAATIAMSRNGNAASLTDVAEHTIQLGDHTITVGVDNNLGSNANAAEQRIDAVISNLQAKFANLSPDQQADAKNITEIVVTAQIPRSATDQASGIFGISYADLMAGSSLDWWASAVVHDGHHVTQLKTGQPSTGIEAEQDASRVQQDALNRFGAFSEAAGLTTYINNPGLINSRINEWPSSGAQFQ